MVNPLARVVMENIAKKSKNTETKVNKGYTSTASKNLSNRGKRTDLDSLADKLRGSSRERTEDRIEREERPVKPSKNIDFKTKNRNNLSFDELKLLSGAIKGDVKVESRNNSSNKNNNALSLDSLAESIKNKN